MAFRDHGEALQARVEALERENLDLQKQLSDQQKTASEAVVPRRRKWGPLVVGAGVSFFAAGLVLGYVGLHPPYDIILALCGIFGTTLVLAGLMVTALQSCLHLVGPNELLVISGRAHQRPDGSVAGYRVVRAGRFISWPLIETVKRISLSNIPLSLELTAVPLAGGDRADVTCTASVKIDHEEPGLQNAVERFLDASRETVTTVAHETLEGLLRSVAKHLTLEELQEDPAFLSKELFHRGSEELRSLGLVLDTFHIKRVNAG